MESYNWFGSKPIELNVDRELLPTNLFCMGKL